MFRLYTLSKRELNPKAHLLLWPGTSSREVCIRLTHQLASCDKFWLYFLDHMIFGLGVIFLE